MPPAVPYPYFPPKTRTRTQTQLVREADPDWRPAMSGKQPEFQFSNGRTFSAVPSQRHPYDIED